MGYFHESPIEINLADLGIEAGVYLVVGKSMYEVDSYLALMTYTGAKVSSTKLTGKLFEISASGATLTVSVSQYYSTFYEMRLC